MNGENNSNQQSAETVNQVTEQGIKASRFSRRRFLTTSAAASPVLFAVKSPMAWGSGQYSSNCSIMMSGNASTIETCVTQAFDPKTWQEVLDADSLGERFYLLFKALKEANITKNSECLGVLFKEVLSVSKSYKGCTYRIKKSSSSTQKFGQALSGAFGKCDLVVRVKPNGQKEFEHTFDMTEFFGVASCGYLNAFFSKSVIDYPFDEAKLRNEVNIAYINAVKSLIDDFKKSPSKYIDNSKSKQSKTLNTPELKVNNFSVLASKLKSW